MRLSKESLIIGIFSILFLGGMGWLIWHSPSVAPSTTVDDTSVLSNTKSHMTGTEGAKVTMVEFGDFQCPACGLTYPSIQKVVDKYAANPDFNFVFRNFPLPQHANAPEAAEAAEAAGAAGKYWEMHHMLYEHQNDWVNLGDPTETFVAYAKTLGLDTTKFRAEVSAKKYKAVIEADMNDANRAGVDATPTIYINGSKLPNSSITEKGLTEAIETALSK